MSWCLRFRFVKGEIQIEFLEFQLFILKIEEYKFYIGKSTCK